MSKRTFLTLFTCAILGTAIVCDAWAQPGPAAPGTRGRGGFGRGQFSPPGPPAPVPPEVTMLRPTSEELATINAELQQFVNTNTSANKDLLKKYASLLVLQAPRDNPCIRPSSGARTGRHA